MAISTELHGAPTAAVRAGIVVEEEAAGGIGTTANGGTRLDQEFGGGTGDRREQPFEAAFPRDKLQGPCAIAGDEFVVSFGDAKNLVNGLDPGRRIMFFIDDRRKDGAKRLTKAANAEQDGVDSLRFVEQQRTKAGGTFFGNETRVREEGDEFLPREVVGGRRAIGEVEGEASGDKVRGRSRVRRHVTGISFHDGYSRIRSNATARELSGRQNRPCLRMPENEESA